MSRVLSVQSTIQTSENDAKREWETAAQYFDIDSRLMRAASPCCIDSQHQTSSMIVLAGELRILSSAGSQI